MKISFKSILTLSFCILIPLFGFSQVVLVKANRYYEQMAYSKAIPKYLAALKKDSMNAAIGLKLADCYRLTHNSGQAERWYSKAVKSSSFKPIDKFYYAQALMSNGKYAEARRWLEEYKQLEPGDKRAESLVKSIDNINGYSEDSQNFSLEKININSPNTDFGAVEYKDGIIFISSRDRNQPISRTHSWTGEKFLAVYKASGKEGQFEEPKLFEKSIQTIYNDGPACFNKLGDEMYLTTNNIEEGKTRRSNDGIVKLKIYKYTLIENEWIFTDTLPANNDQYNVAHACISADGTKLFFASDMPGGKGGMDIYVCTKKDKTWGEPINLGDKVNSPGNEVFPYIKSDGMLYFSSNGHDGLGGLDIYSAQEKDEFWTEVKNLMAPMNSKEDDFAISFTKNGQNGYISSNRNTNIYAKTSDDNIYYFTVLKPTAISYTINLKDSVTETDLTDAELTIIDAEGKSISVKSANGIFNVDLIPNKTYKVNTNVFAYINQQIEWSTSKKNLSKIIKLQRSLGIDLEIVIRESFVNQKSVEGLKVNIVKVNTNKTEEFVSAQDGKVNAILLPESTYFIVAAGKGKTSNKYYVSTVGISEGNKIYKTIYLDNTADPNTNKTSCLLSGVLLDKTSNEPVKDAKVTFYDANYKKQEAITDAAGKYLFYNLELNQDYKIVVAKDGYFTQSAGISTKGNKTCKTFTRPFFMDKIVLNKAIKIDNIYFDTGKWTIRTDAAKELNKVIQLLKDNPTIIIELSSHTDSRGTSESNLSLSDSRAKASAQYIIENGIEKSRVSGKGYGESMPINKCSDGVNCSDAEYQVNRRTEFKVIGNTN
jgi:outer membrane protein OmpA-like peptidoglycan-associated protein/tetratricopeptide (TPR) repeat protein